MTRFSKLLEPLVQDLPISIHQCWLNHHCPPLNNSSLLLKITSKLFLFKRRKKKKLWIIFKPLHEEGAAEMKRKTGMEAKAEVHNKIMNQKCFKQPAVLTTIGKQHWKQSNKSAGCDLLWTLRKRGHQQLFVGAGMDIMRMGFHKPLQLSTWVKRSTPNSKDESGLFRLQWINNSLIMIPKIRQTLTYIYHFQPAAQYRKHF